MKLRMMGFADGLHAHLPPKYRRAIEVRIAVNLLLHASCCPVARISDECHCTVLRCIGLA